jgi:phage baseplate assembly protein W
MAEYPSGIGFPFKFSNAGGVQEAQGNAKLESNLNALVRSPVGKRLIRKSIGTVSYQKVFRNLQAISFDPLRSFLMENISDLEPRIQLVDLSISMKEFTNGNGISLVLSYFRKGSPTLNVFDIDLD